MHLRGSCLASMCARAQITSIYSQQQHTTHNQHSDHVLLSGRARSGTWRIRATVLRKLLRTPECRADDSCPTTAHRRPELYKLKPARPSSRQNNPAAPPVPPQSSQSPQSTQSPSASASQAFPHRAVLVAGRFAASPAGFPTCDVAAGGTSSSTDCSSPLAPPPTWQPPERPHRAKHARVAVNRTLQDDQTCQISRKLGFDMTQ